MPREIVRKSGRTWTEYVNSHGSVLDKLALKILESHGKGHLACVALCVIPDKNDVLVATNGFTLDFEKSKVCVRDALEIDNPIVTQVTMNRLSDMHAEMKLLCSLKNDYHFADDDFEGLRIGVSKPCCCFCAAVLDFYKVTYSMYHGEDTYWLSPFNTEIRDREKLYQKDEDGNWHVTLHLQKDFPNGVDINGIFAF